MSDTHKDALGEAVEKLQEIVRFNNAHNGWVGKSGELAQEALALIERHREEEREAAFFAGCNVGWDACKIGFGIDGGSDCPADAMRAAVREYIAVTKAAKEKP